MSSPQGDMRSSDVEMGEATSQTPAPAPSVEEPACVAGFLSFQVKLARCKAEKESVRAAAELPSSSALAVAQTHGPEVQVPQDVGTQGETSVLCVPDALAQPTGSSMTPILARLTKISNFLGSLDCIRGRDLALATVEGGMVVVWALQSETPPCLEAEESGCPIAREIRRPWTGILISSWPT
ncbi:hypothetical protein F2Q69_00005534 [Brassica cretica]|uniref:Uncharacterized protein n=1 Tax=Brassica cretica TaxID=69181 RepID=A0A8S9NSR1_BRACR|nr:hypothetical protein F2Q69_00005534 [Brassica cretica]